MNTAKKIPSKAAPELTAQTPEVTASVTSVEFLKPFTDIQEKVRAGTEKGVEQFRAHYATLKDNAEAMTSKLDESLAAANSGTREFNSKALEFVRAQANAGFAHLQALVAVKSLGDAVRLNQDFVRAQVETLQAHTQAVAELAKKVTEDVAEPVKAAMVLPFRK